MSSIKDVQPKTDFLDTLLPLWNCICFEKDPTHNPPSPPRFPNVRIVSHINVRNAKNTKYSTFWTVVYAQYDPAVRGREGGRWGGGCLCNANYFAFRTKIFFTFADVLLMPNPSPPSFPRPPSVVVHIGSPPSPPFDRTSLRDAGIDVEFLKRKTYFGPSLWGGQN